MWWHNTMPPSSSHSTGSISESVLGFEARAREQNVELLGLSDPSLAEDPTEAHQKGRGFRNSAG